MVISKGSACSAGDAGDIDLIPGGRRSLGRGNGNLILLPGKFHGAGQWVTNRWTWLNMHHKNTLTLNFIQIGWSSFPIWKRLFGSPIWKRASVNLPAIVRLGILGINPEVGKIPLEDGMATHSSILAWRIPMDGGAWWATVHGVTENQTWLGD